MSVGVVVLGLLGWIAAAGLFLAALWWQMRVWSRLGIVLRLGFWDRAASWRVMCCGVTGVDPATQRMVTRFRLVNAAMMALLLVLGGFVVGWVVLTLLVPPLVVMLVAKPFRPQAQVTA